MKGKRVLNFGCRFFILGVDKQDIPVDLFEPYTCEEPIKGDATDDERHTCCDCLILDGSDMHLSRPYASIDRIGALFPSGEQSSCRPPVIYLGYRAAAHDDDVGCVRNRRQLEKGNGEREQDTFHERFIVPSTVKRSCRNKAIARFARGVMSRMPGKPAPEGSMFRVGNLL